MTLGASNVSFGLPGRHALGAAFLALASYAGLTSAIMDARNPLDRRRVPRGRSAPRARRVGDELDRRAPAGAGGGRNRVTHPRGSGGRAAPGRRTGPRHPALRTLGHDRPGAARRDPVRCRLVERDRDRLDLRRSRDVQEVPRPDRGRRRPGLAARRARLHACGTRGGLASRLPRAGGRAASRSRCRRSSPGPKAATVGVGRQVILHPALQKRYVELDEPALHDQRTDLQRLQDAIDDLELRAEAGVLRRLPRVLRRVGLPRHGGRRRRPADRRRARRHDRAPACDRVRPRHDNGGRDPDRRRDRHSGRRRARC